MDYNELILKASETLPYPATMSDFQETFLRHVSTEYEYLDRAGAEMIVALLSTLLFASMPVFDIVGTFAYLLINGYKDLYFRLNLVYLGATRNARIAERVCDKMEYEGYW